LSEVGCPSQLSENISEQSFWFHVCFTFVCRYPSIHLSNLHVNRWLARPTSAIYLHSSRSAAKCRMCAL
jgi:hypothetical protein